MCATSMKSQEAFLPQLSTCLISMPFKHQGLLTSSQQTMVREGRQYIEDDTSSIPIDGSRAKTICQWRRENVSDDSEGHTSARTGTMAQGAIYARRGRWRIRLCIN